MLTPYEVVAGRVCPAVRGIVAKKLLKHKMTQREAAQRLGLTQQAVSNYSLGSRGLAKYLGKIKTIDKLTDELVGAVLDGKDEIRVTLMLSRICDYILSSRIVCSHVKPDACCPLCMRKPKECKMRLIVNAMKEASGSFPRISIN
jgi:predicted transcriptional regulator